MKARLGTAIQADQGDGLVDATELLLTSETERFTFSTPVLALAAEGFAYQPAPAFQAAPEPASPTILASAPEQPAPEQAALEHPAEHAHGFYDGAPAGGIDTEDYAFGGGKWGPSLARGTTGGTVTWSVAGSGWFNASTDRSWFSGPTTSLSNFLNFDYVSVLKQAFGAWSAVANISFVQVEDGGGNMGSGTSADIRVGGAFMDGRPAGSSVLAAAFYPSTYGPRIVAQSGDIVFDSAEGGFWNPSSFLAVASHEIGHSIGLAHSFTPNALMYPYYNPSITAPQADDIAGARATYGVFTPPTGFTSPTLRLSEFGANAGGWISEDRLPRELADVNGDGMADIVGFGFGGTLVSLATGGGNFAGPSLVITEFGAGAGAGGWASDNLVHRTLGDGTDEGMVGNVGSGRGGTLVSIANGGGKFAAPTLARQDFGS